MREGEGANGADDTAENERDDRRDPPRRPGPCIGQGVVRGRVGAPGEEIVVPRGAPITSQAWLQATVIRMSAVRPAGLRRRVIRLAGPHDRAGSTSRLARI